MPGNKGQNIAEFVIVIVLIAIAGILVLTTLGSNVKTMFSKSEKSYKVYQPFNYGSPVVSEENIEGYTVKTHQDGSVTFNVGGQEVNLTKELLDLHTTVLETTGSSGISNIVKELAYIIEKNKDKYEPGQVPVEILFGSGVRESITVNYVHKTEGSAEANTVSFQVGNDFVIIQNDVACEGAQCSITKGTYRIEGTIGANNNIENVKVDVKTETGSNTYTKGSLIDGVVKKDGNSIMIDGIYHEDYHNYDSSWNMTFDNPAYRFEL